jgi:hypothetical protein
VLTSKSTPCQHPEDQTLNSQTVKSGSIGKESDLETNLSNEIGRFHSGENLCFVVLSCETVSEEHAIFFRVEERGGLVFFRDTANRLPGYTMS